AAYDHCINGDIIKTRAAIYNESPNFNSPLDISVSLEGGFDVTFGTQAGVTTMQGLLTISRGTVEAGNFSVR
ncbi:MAG: hypothetical protein WA610_12940, partial [Thermodesulfovibrionales bacterium]